MGNAIIEGPIPLGGSGFIAKENGNFQPGEYKRLCNLEIDSSGFLINRRNVYSVHGENTGAAVVPVDNPQRFLGNMGSYSIISKGDTQYIAGESTFLELWRLSEGGGPTPAPSYSQFLGFFRYNNKNYWLVFEFESAIRVSLVLYYDADIPVPDIPETYGPGYGASLTRTVILNFASGTTDFYEFQFKNFFIYKERLWIATTVGLYFSKATDPTVFAVPDGGFFKHPGNRVNYAFAIKDNVYTLCDDAVYAMTYSTDPNVDSSERPLSDTIGGEMGCVHLDTPYFINNLGIFVINGNNIDKVMDSRFDYGKDAYSNRIFSFEEYLVVNKYSPINYDNNYSPPAKVTTRQNLWQSPESDAVGGSQIINGWTVSGSPDVQTRTNYVINPRVEIDPNEPLGDYFVDTFGGEYVLGHANVTKYLGNFSGYVERTSSAGTLDIKVHTWVTSVLPGRTYAASVYVETPVNRAVKLHVVYQNAASEEIGRTTNNYDVVGGVWTRLSRVVTPPAGTAFIFIQIVYRDVAGTANHHFDAVMIEESATVNPYFDGAFEDDSFKTYAWSDVAHESFSTLTVKTCIMDAVVAAIDDISTGKVLRWGGTFVDPNDLLGTTIGPNDVWGKSTYTFDPTTAFVSGIPYTFRFDHKGNGSWAGAKLEFKLEYLDITNAVIGSSDHTVSAEYNPSASYQTFLLSDIVFPAGTEKMRVTYTFTLDVTEQVGTTAWSIDLNKFLVEKTSTYSGYFTGATTDTADVTYSWAGVAFASESTTGSATTHSYLRNNGSKFEPFQQGNTLGYNTYFINTENGSCHVLDFVDQYEAHSHGEAGFIVDALVNPFSNASGNYKIMLLTNKAISETESGHSYKANVYYISSSEDIAVNDYAVDNLNVLKRRAPKIDVEIDSFVPDGLEYRIKKFRSLLLQGVMPPAGMQLDVSYDNHPITQTTDLGDNEAVLSHPRRHYAHRIGLNQRGRSITLRLRNLLWPDALASAYGDLEISDMRVMWTYTQRLPSTRRIGS